MLATETKPTAWMRARVPLSIFAISVGISLFTTAYETAVNPLFGSDAIAKYLNYVVHGSTVMGIILPKPSRPLLLLLLAVLVEVAPHTSYWISVFAARNGDPVLGSLLTHVSVLAPVIYLAASLAASIDYILATVVLAVNALQLRPLILLVARHFSLDTHKDVVFLILGSITTLVWTLEKLEVSRPSSGASLSNIIGITRKLWAMSIPAIFLFPALRSPTLSGSSVFPYQCQVYSLRILSSRDSVTGVIVVGELLYPTAETANPAALHPLRYLRASHSLLGGVWIGSDIASLDDVPSRTDQAGTPLGDSIYGAFVLQEAVRLVNSSAQGDTGKQKQQNALVIGLGAGISADAFVRHGISTTIVEIDPAVYDAARKYFGLEDPGDDHIFLEDARNWVYKRRAAMQSDDNKDLPTFDVVVHDCFSGGRVPQHLFSVEFWNDLKWIMKPDGVVAVNFAGRLGSQSTRAVVTTLLRVFGRCRVLHDSPTPIPEDRFSSDFLNLVFFCSPSSYPFTFRSAIDSDYLHSDLRRHLLSSLEKREVSISQLKGGNIRSEGAEQKFVLTDMNNMLNTWQSEEALEHWKLMRRVLPDIVWETY